MKLILGSQSPRRKEIMNYFDLPFQQVASHFDEDSLPFNGNPSDYTIDLAKKKGEVIAAKFPDAMILTADTVVYKDGKIYGKPVNDQQAKQFLTELAGQWHSVYTGINLSYDGKEFSKTSETRVLFNPLTEKQIDAYNQKLHYADKAGGYMIQQAGGIIVQRIEGCYYNVMGLPINSLRELLLNFNIDLWDHIGSR